MTCVRGAADGVGRGAGVGVGVGRAAMLVTLKCETISRCAGASARGAGIRPAMIS